MAPNPYEDVHRRAKALRIASALRSHGFTVEAVMSFDDDQKQMAIRIAGTLPASQKTWDVVAEIIATLPGPETSPLSEL